MTNELAALCEQYHFTLALDYNATEEVWSVDISRGKTHVYNSFIFKGTIAPLLQNAYNAMAEYIKKERSKQLELF